VTRRLGIALVAAASLGGLCSRGFSPPPPDACNSPASATADALVIGTGDDSTFTPLHDDDVVHLVIGGQGGRMLPVRLQLAGASTPSCIAQTTTVSMPQPALDGGVEQISRDTAPLNTYVQPDGTFLTKPDYLVLSLFGAVQNPLLVQVDALGLTTTVRVWIDARVYDGGL
jgi:hypothetical protein